MIKISRYVLLLIKNFERTQIFTIETVKKRLTVQQDRTGQQLFKVNKSDRIAISLLIKREIP